MDKLNEGGVSYVSFFDGTVVGAFKDTVLVQVR